MSQRFPPPDVLKGFKSFRASTALNIMSDPTAMTSQHINDIARKEVEDAGFTWSADNEPVDAIVRVIINESGSVNVAYSEPILAFAVCVALQTCPAGVSPNDLFVVWMGATAVLTVARKPDVIFTSVRLSVRAALNDVRSHQ